jgi:F-type H+-transporting ATPase subunit epsilon
MDCRVKPGNDEREDHMASLHFDLVAPEKLLFSGEVRQVDLPGAEGDFGVLADHAPLIATLRPGVLVIHEEAGERLRIVVHGGFAEVTASGLTVLADAAVPAEEVDVDVLSGIIKDTEEDVADTKDDWQRDKLSRRLAQLRALREELAH